MSDFKYRREGDNDHDGHDVDGGDDSDHEDGGHNVHDDRELITYVHDMLRALEAITAGRSLNPLSRSIGAAKELAHSILIHG